MATRNDLDQAAMSLPEVELGTSWGDRPTYKVHGKGFIIFRGPRPDAVDEAGQRLEDVVVFSCADEQDKEALVADPSTPFFTTDHFNGYNAVLLRQAHFAQLTREELTEVVTDAWLCKAPKRVARGWLTEHGLEPEAPVRR